MRQASAQEEGRNRETGRETAVQPRQLGGVAYNGAGLFPARLLVTGVTSKERNGALLCSEFRLKVSKSEAVS